MAKLQEFESNDADDQAEALFGFEQRYEQLGCGRFQGTLWQVLMADGLLLRETTNRKLRELVSPQPDYIALAMPLSVAPGSVYAGRPLGRESLMVLNGQEEHDIVSAGEMDLIGLCVHRDMLAQLAPAKVEWLQRAERERNLALAPDSAAAIRQMLMAVCGDAEAEIDNLANPVHERALLSATLTQTVILAMAGDPQSTHIPRRAETRQKVVRRAIDYMRAHLEDDIGIPEICAAACASRRSLQYCFEELMHTTPQAYLRALRLNEARRVLKAQADQPITVLASTLGFANASHFTRHYKLMFDELPSETLKAFGVNAGSLTL